MRGGWLAIYGGGVKLNKKTSGVNLIYKGYFKMDKKEIKTLLENIGGNWYILKLGSVEQLMAAGNSERFGQPYASLAD